MPFKRAGWLQRLVMDQLDHDLTVSMPFKRAGWLQLRGGGAVIEVRGFQCPLSGLVGCNGMC